MLPRHRSKKEVVYEFLKEAIIRGKYEPGSRLVIDDLANKLNVSQIPIREAIQQLESDGFVITEPYIGAKITEIDATFIFEVFALLEAHEIICSRNACVSMSEEDLKILTKMIDEMDNLVNDADKWSEQNKAMHLFICDCANTQLVQKMLEKVFAHWDRLRLYYFKDVSKQRTKEAQAEHKLLLKALEKRDPNEVEQIIRKHNQSALKSYIHHLELQGLITITED